MDLRKNFMQQAQIILIENSFNTISKNPEQFAEDFYRELFAQHPEIAILFEQTTIEQQAEKLYLALSMVIQNLRYPGMLRYSLRELGKRHRDEYAILDEHTYAFKMVFLESLKNMLQDEWSQDLAQVWGMAFDQVIEMMLD